ncbi:hypothetical protein A3752_09865 [Oleiphilus sp. HI0081]|uniref:DUF6122 family protein n=1 Tax=unclassified Oleiphilus TaxID=2631174 RepID=UPI0007C39DB4|nr:MULTISPECIES: DUF6122 family protein [unclassified Oleiphilus]KZY42760.1 hypothetical protein A3732_02395 [Oleiphilus sp. HI0050]KZY77661.1 hypothetical protein A3740_09800 [Oleiphilus sp. HI0068]KZY81015.1 hypothetical protein A3741_18035 [Oleiphilus sp. HI0069]KZY96931.1 hypothetical protein A3743_04225 [Oleiphilus sp. HI0072]KZZ06982.1 hypothetical protein A3749_16165 [Oleiphilus sp. HI0078]KZZ21095.1 hypothetical protein A3752_09865 [Oleiphilus sp. HI0081]KZZ42764.1 hypothetical prote
MLHIALHFLVPLLVATAVFAKTRDSKFTVKIYLLLVATMLVDLDHLLAVPIYDPGRCSIGFHPLHKEFMIPVYALMALFPATRWIGIGLLIHMGLDAQDCWRQGFYGAIH